MSDKYLSRPQTDLLSDLDQPSFTVFYTQRCCLLENHEGQFVERLNRKTVKSLIKYGYIEPEFKDSANYQITEAGKKALNAADERRWAKEAGEK